jgi:hypothetical protein
VNLDYIVATSTLMHIFATLSLDSIVDFDTIIVFPIPLVALLISPVVWHKEHVLNFSVLKRLQLSNLVTLLTV